MEPLTELCFWDDTQNEYVLRSTVPQQLLYDSCLRDHQRVMFHGHAPETVRTLLDFARWHQVLPFPSPPANYKNQAMYDKPRPFLLQWVRSLPQLCDLMHLAWVVEYSHLHYECIKLMHHYLRVQAGLTDADVPLSCTVLWLGKEPPRYDIHYSVANQPPQQLPL